MAESEGSYGTVTSEQQTETQPQPQPQPQPQAPEDSFEAIVDKDAKLDRFLLEAVQLIKQMHDLKMEIKLKQNQFEEDRIRLLKSSYLTLHTQKLGNFMDILKAVEEITK